MICTRLLFDQGNKEKYNVFCGKNPIDKVKVGYFKQLQIKYKSFGYIFSGNLWHVIIKTIIDYKIY